MEELENLKASFPHSSKLGKTMSEEEKELSGPLGLWRWPILNFIRHLFKTFRGEGGGIISRMRGKSVNVEIWEWTDYLGRKRQLTVHREIE